MMPLMPSPWPCCRGSAGISKPEPNSALKICKAWAAVTVRSWCLGGHSPAPGQTALHGGDDPQPQLLRLDDRIDRAHPLSAMNRMHAVELGRDLGQLLRAHAG